MTWIEKGVLKNIYYDAATARRQKVAPSTANPNMSLVVEGTNQSIEDMIKTTKRGLLVTFFWYLRPVDTLTLLNTGMTRDGLFLIENGEIAGPVQNFRWNMSPLVALRQHLGGRQVGADSHRRSLRRPRHRARPADPGRRLLHDVGVTGGLRRNRGAAETAENASHIFSACFAVSAVHLFVIMRDI